MDRKHPSGLPYCDGEYCDEAGLYLHTGPPEHPYHNKHLCPSCLKIRVYNAASQKKPNLPDNVLPLKKKNGTS